MEKVNIREALASIDEHWSQKIIGAANGSLYKVAKGLGATNWHKHDDQDELFILYRGHLVVNVRENGTERAIDLYDGDMLVVPKGTEHRPVAEMEAEFLVAGINITSTAAGGKPNL